MDRGSQLDEDNEDNEEDKEDEEEEDEAGGGRRKAEGGSGSGRQEEEAATDIKSNNPHLAGGEKMALFVTCSNSKKRSRETVAAFRLHLANPPLRLPPCPSPASFRTSPLASSILYSTSKGMAC